MNKPIIVLKVAPKEFIKVKSLALSVYENMNLNPKFVNPQPPMLVLNADIVAITDNLARWGEVGNRGSHQDHVDLVRRSAILRTWLAQLGAWCMSSMDAEMSYDEQTVILSSSGFPLKNAKAPVGRLEMVQDFHRFISRTVTEDQVKMRWKKPLGVRNSSNVKNYSVYRNTTNDFATASIIAQVPNTTYTDEPGSGTWFYWVVAFNNKGAGVTSHVVIAKIA